MNFSGLLLYYYCNQINKDMNKILNFLGFYFLLVMNFLAVMNPISWVFVLAIVLDIIFFPVLSKLPKEKIYEVSGMNLLQKIFKNNMIINELTTEE